MTRIVLLALLLAGCVRTSSEFLDDRTAMVSGRGGTAHSGADIMKGVMVKAAILARQRGYSHFQILDRSDASRNVLTGKFPGSIMGVTMPGTDIMVRFYHAHEAEGVAGIWSADSVLAAAAQK